MSERPSATLRQVGWIDQNGWLHPLTKADPEDGWVSVYVIENDPTEQQEGDEYRRTYGRDADHSRAIEIARSSKADNDGSDAHG